MHCLEIYQDPAMVEMFKSVIESCCEIEQDVDHETALIDNFQCNSVEEFDKEITKLLAESHESRPTAKHSNRYTKFIKDLEDIQYANQQSQVNQTQINQSVTTVDGMTVQDFAVRTDPITKSLIKNPYINRTCKHVYDFDSISEAIRMNKKIR
jgi:SUMO ligase MMS21 Smc5/6 complex component